MYMLRCVCVCVCVCMCVCVCVCVCLGINVYLCVYLHAVIFCKLDHFHVCTCHLLHVYCSYFSYNHFNLLLPFWGRKDLSYWVKLLTFPAHVSMQ